MQSTHSEKVAIIAGALGMNGYNLINCLLDHGDWKIIGLSRRPATEERWLANPNYSHISVDLLNDEDSKEKLRSTEVSKATHLFFAAYLECSNEYERIEVNMKLLRNTVENIDKSAKNLKKIILITGTKYYGVHLNKPFKTPAKEDDPRLNEPIFYYNQEDYIAEKQKGKSWNWTVIRPHDIVGFAGSASAMNMGTSLALYATLCKEKGWPFRFPGTQTAMRQLYDSSSADLLTRMTVWLAGDVPATNNQAFNTVNGDTFRWLHLWPVIAKYFGLTWDSSQQEPFRLADNLKGEEFAQDWDRIVKKYNLKQTKLSDLATWGFVDWVVNREYDCITDSNKIYEAGFTERKNSERMYLDLFDRLKQENIIPSYSSNQ